jgi:hypothetical protein
MRRRARGGRADLRAEAGLRMGEAGGREEKGKGNRNTVKGRRERTDRLKGRM